LSRGDYDKFEQKMMKEASASNSSGTTVTHPPCHDKWKRARQKPTL